MEKMDNFTFGLTLTIVGMGGTLLTLWILSALMDLLKKVYPLTEGKKSSTKKD